MMPNNDAGMQEERNEWMGKAALSWGWNGFEGRHALAEDWAFLHRDWIKDDTTI